MTHEEAKRAAVQRSSGELARLNQAGLMLNVPMSTVSEAFDIALRKVDAEQKSIEVLKATVAGDEQGLRFTADVKGKLENPPATFTATLSGWAVMDLANHSAQVQPGFSSARITSLDFERWTFAGGPAAAAANALLGRYINNVNGQIKPIVYTLEPEKIGLMGQPVPVKLPSGKTVTLPGVKLGAAAVLVEETGIHLMAELLVSQSDPPKAVPGEDSYAAYQQAFWRKAAAVGSDAQSKAPGLFVSNALLTSILRPAFEPIQTGIEALQQRALFDVMDALGAAGEVVAGAYVSADTLRSQTVAAMRAAWPKGGELVFHEPEVRLGEQTLRVDLPVEGTIKSAQLRFQGRVSAAGLLAPKGRSLYYRLVVASVQVEQVEYTGGQLQLAGFVGTLNGLIAQLLPYVNAALDTRPIGPKLPVVKPIPVSAPGVEVTPKELTVSLPNAVSVIPRLDERGLRLLVVELPGVVAGTVPSAGDVDLDEARRLAEQLQDTTPPPTVPQSADSTPDVTPSDVNAAFEKRWASALPPVAASGEAPRSVESVVAMRWVMSTVNRVLAENRLSVAAQVDSGKLEFKSGELKVAGWLQPGCTADKKCSRRPCTRRECKRESSCDWSCRRCVKSGKIVKFTICGDDPACKASRYACNVKEEARVAACNAEQLSQQSACNVREETELAACNVQRNVEIAGCNIVNETIRAVKEVDSIGKFSGDAQVKARAWVSEPELAYDAARSELSLGVKLDATADIRGDLAFVPHDIGHILVCPVPGSVPFKIDGNLEGGRTVVKARIQQGAVTSSGTKLDLTFDAVPVRGKLSPSPVDALLTRNPHLFVTCNPVLTATITGANALGKVSAFSSIDVMKALERAIPGNQEDVARMVKAVTSGVVDQSVQLPPMQVEIPSMTFQNGTEEIALTARWRDGHLFFGMP